MMSRYDAHGIETEFEPGSRGRVLRNLLGIRSAREMSRAESAALLQAQDRLVDSFSLDHRFTTGDICEMHRVWLGDIYSWAGQYRSVNIAAFGFWRAKRKNGKAELHCGDTRCHRRGLYPDDGYFPRRGLSLFATVRPVALERLTVGGASLEKGWRMPSTAEDVLADTHRLSLRITGSRK